ncbi:MAG TPA: hypothetical protein VF993_06460 [Myxococcales bacterium]
MSRRASLIAALALCACAKEYVIVPDSQASMPALIAPELGRRPLRPPPTSYKFRVAVLDFTDQTNSAGDLVRTMPDILTTSLFDTRRYDIYDRGQLRNKSPQEVEKEVHDLAVNGIIDGEILGSITRFSPADRTMIIDVRLINGRSSAVMFAREQPIHYKGVLDVQVERKDLQELAKLIKDAVPEDVPEARIAAKNGDELVISAGSNLGIIKGMTAFVVASGDTIEHPESGETLSSRSLIAEVYVTAVEKQICRAQIARPRPDEERKGFYIQVNDLVRFK